MPEVYILKSLKNGRYYVGSTNNLERRLKEHNQGTSRYTSFTKPFEIVFNQSFESIETARRVELKLKRYKSKKILDEIVEDGYIKLRDD